MCITVCILHVLSLIRNAHPAVVGPTDISPCTDRLSSPMSTNLHSIPPELLEDHHLSLIVRPRKLHGHSWSTGYEVGQCLAAFVADLAMRVHQALKIGNSEMLQVSVSLEWHFSIREDHSRETKKKKKSGLLREIVTGSHKLHTSECTGLFFSAFLWHEPHSSSYQSTANQQALKRLWWMMDVWRMLVKLFVFCHPLDKNI